jgi:putative phosphoribosyl transferase
LSTNTPARPCGSRAKEVQSECVNVFAGRRDAGVALGAAVRAEIGSAPGQSIVRSLERPIVIALARGGVPVGREVAEAVDADLDVMVVRKIGLPGREEYGVGAVTSSGHVHLDSAVLKHFGLARDDLQEIIDQGYTEAVRRIERYRPHRDAPTLGNRLVIVVDDGVAAGVTARAAIAEIRAHHPAAVVFAAPVGAADSLASLGADRVVCPHTPYPFGSVGRWYADFHQVTDAEVQEALAR